MDYDKIKLHIYEKYDSNKINDSERNELLGRLNYEYTVENYCINNGLIPVDDDNIYFESIRAAIGKFIRDKIDIREIKKRWNALASKFQHGWKVKLITQDQKDKLTKSFEKVKQEKILYPEYKRHFNILAKSVDLPTNNIIMETVVFNKDDNGADTISIRYSKGKQKVMIPNGTCLLHVSPKDGIPELKPSFKSKVSGKYMYPTPRIYFTLGKEIKPTKAGLEHTKSYKYTPKENFKFGFIDPSCTKHADSAIYVETMNPIIVMDFNEKMKKIYIESSNGMNTEILKDRFTKLIYESVADGKISFDQSQTLFEYLKLIK